MKGKQKMLRVTAVLSALLLLIMTGCAVSYTHLDVYKRQLYRNVIAWINSSAKGN